MKDLTNPSRDGKHFVSMILTFYVKGMINDDDYARLEKELLDVVRAERGIAVRTVTRRQRPTAACGGVPAVGQRPTARRTGPRA